MARLLEQGDPPPVVVEGEDRPSPFLIVCEHAGRAVPRRLGTLGLSDTDLSRHIAWDIGAETMARTVADKLGATLVVQPISRLVIDCNRPIHNEQSIWTVSDGIEIPGNLEIGGAERQARIDEVFTPFHDTVAGLIDAREAAGRETVLATIHSFTPVYQGFERPWHAGAQYNHAPEFSHIVNAILGEDGSLCVGDNEPYPVNDETHYTIPVHGERRGIAHTMIEVRQDLLASQGEQEAWGQRLADVLVTARERYLRARPAREPHTAAPGGDPLLRQPQ